MPKQKSEAGIHHYSPEDAGQEISALIVMQAFRFLSNARYDIRPYPVGSAEQIIRYDKYCQRLRIMTVPLAHGESVLPSELADTVLVALTPEADNIEVLREPGMTGFQVVYAGADTGRPDGNLRIIQTLEAGGAKISGKYAVCNGNGGSDGAKTVSQNRMYADWVRPADFASPQAHTDLRIIPVGFEFRIPGSGYIIGPVNVSGIPAKTNGFSG
ncbi:hypothetical protein A2Z33_01835 [Candidatus Gottesmanbacteria bacterium RBG_16_52_11]|uniref:Uncharacterized protein n=1 Tax=Candidatus Gottesmanbacteria bacterium RBG_16_52_11 TaxID=1798374 RepID=A0A1F5YQP8_9BACT|nr:MAG: hypothetical protein A2Z33_01835 [Candidatus Gottesmanbacteria bacterium RBG_16_52_11]